MIAVPISAECEFSSGICTTGTSYGRVTVEYALYPDIEVDEEIYGSLEPVKLPDGTQVPMIGGGYGNGH